ncbi:MAG: tetratricopeptide repeat protein [Spirochaetia bacterium]|nr:tetratricopeptide repeat protein [Spirochaetia bacterium]
MTAQRIIFRLFLVFLTTIFVPGCVKDVPSKTALSLDSIMADSPDFNLEKALMAANALIDPDADYAGADRELSIMAQLTRDAINGNTDPQVIMETLNRVFFINYGFEFDKRFSALIVAESADEANRQIVETQVNYTSIPRVLERRQGICLSLAAIYLIIGERLGLPVYGVLVPGHIFVRYNDAIHSGINSETTFSGMEYYDYAVLTGSGFLKGTDYNRLLTKRETAAAVLNNYAALLMADGRAKDAEMTLKKSVEILPGLVENRVNLGSLYLALMRYPQAEAQLLEAVKIMPESAQARLLLGELYRGSKRYVLARENYLAALAASPGDAAAAKGLEMTESMSKEALHGGD